MKLETKTIKVAVPGFNKEVSLQVPTEIMDLTSTFNEMSSYVQSLATHNKIRDLDAGINPAGATHEITKTKSGDYILNRFRF